MSEALIGALIGAGAAVVVQVIAAFVSNRVEATRLDFERQRLRFDELATARAEIRARKQQTFVDLLTNTNKIIRAVDELSASGRVPDTTPLDRDRLLRSVSEVSLYAPTLVDPLNALSAHLSSDGLDAYRKRLADWLTKAHRLRDQLIQVMRESLWSEQNDEARPAAQRGHAPQAGDADP